MKMATKEDKEKQRYEYEIKCFIREKMQSGKKEEQIIEALKVEKNINSEDAIFYINRLNHSEKDSDSNDITWGIISLIGGGMLMLVHQIQPTDDYNLLAASVVIMIYGTFRLLRGVSGKIKKMNNKR